MIEWEKEEGMKTIQPELSLSGKKQEKQGIARTIILVLIHKGVDHRF